MKDKPYHFILDVGTNELNLDLQSKSIAESMVNLAMSLKTELNDVSISPIILRTDKPHLNEKESEVKVHVKELYEEKHISLIDNKKKIKSYHLKKVNFT